MPVKATLIALTAAAAAMVSISAAQAGMNNINLTTPRMPSPPGVTVRPHMIDARSSCIATTRANATNSVCG